MIIAICILAVSIQALAGAMIIWRGIEGPRDPELPVPVVESLTLNDDIEGMY